MSIANPSIYSSTTIISKSFLNGLIGNLRTVMSLLFQRMICVWVMGKNSLGSSLKYESLRTDSVSQDCALS